MQTGQGSESPTNAVSRLISLLAEDRALTSIETAETLWLATKLERPAPTESEPTPPPAPEPLPPLPVDLSEPLEPEPLPPAPPTPQANIATPTPQAGVLPPQTLPVWLADPAMLTDALAVIRALRPLLRTVDTGIGTRLDEAATVETIARTRLCLPVLAPGQRPYFDIVLVVDRSSSMHIWQRLIKDVVRILKRYGVFWNVQVFDLAVNRDPGPTDDPVLLMANPQRPGHRPSELIDQQGQRIAVVLSDCTAPYWWDGTLLPMLQSWGATMPTAVWQVLPPWMWKRTALGRGTAVALANDGFGRANQWLKVQQQERDGEKAEARRLPLPVLTSDLRDLSRWSRMVAGDRRELTPGFLLPQAGGTVPRAKSYEATAQDLAEQLLDADPSLDPDTALDRALNTLAHERVERFLELASPEAQRLIMLLAAAPVITLPVVRLIRDAILEEVTSPLPVAEVFLSGLLQRLPGQADSELEQAVQNAAEQAEANPDGLDPVLPEAQDLVQYDFAPGVRPVLLEFLPPVDTIDVVNSVSAAVERRWNAIATEDFRAFLTDPTMPVAEELQGMRSFASVTADILEPLGGDYTEFTQALKRGAEQQPTSESEGFDLNDFPLQDFEYEVAEFINFPPLEPFEFIEAYFEEDEEKTTFPPPLQTEEFTVITVDLELLPRSLVAQSLESFEFMVATLYCHQAQKGIVNWEIQRRKHRADRYIEVLPDGVSVEMVAIPGGTFLMGSPETEIGHFSDRESPQRKVTIEPLFVGRYPITQEQWRTVAAMPRSKQLLLANPSHFQGYNLPVENVSWDDATEFCARLSAHTGRQYRLLREEEWEYACRAGTATPFHFGETITPELANYRGRVAYADGPQGIFQAKTTPVDSFGVANSFGLCDMHGNVFEWCHAEWGKHDTEDEEDPYWSIEFSYGPCFRRGGSWDDDPSSCRSAYRTDNMPDYRRNFIGFRICCSNFSPD
ncbi:SAV_2336 N-terminal domain-related protein [Nodosilinea sp. PGN35]|uniref:formylglycine-generating enzyme family protein n=1 Tax=Nodosilinea sp. PGN35 TaxID=3020489 RepID=UPI0023B23BBB|nr:formylglycine-generating enzyme family protein [Nodosilinea sp. TSF1-S3]MDF0369136.1 formylglycine-generating enzyme family protein [Nodosilinea sp. TSF1-S3]